MPLNRSSTHTHTHTKALNSPTLAALASCAAPPLLPWLSADLSSLVCLPSSSLILLTHVFCLPIYVLPHYTFKLVSRPDRQVCDLGKNPVKVHPLHCWTDSWHSSLSTLRQYLPPPLFTTVSQPLNHHQVCEVRVHGWYLVLSPAHRGEEDSHRKCSERMACFVCASSTCLYL